MTYFRNLLTCLALSAAVTATFAATPATSPAPAVPASAKKPAAPAANKTASAAPAPATPPPAPAAPAQAGVSLDVYMKELTSVLKLTDPEKQEIQNLYLADSAPTQNILNDATLSPLQQTQQVDNLRDLRNSKIEELLADIERRHEFLKIEARYRVALIERVADGGLVAPPAAAAPAAKS